ncbi:hypothetical protein PHET_09589 [Paragonimus heterotremus]|uniref:Peptidase A2 domain-containing protein n=1 Tax=Paragonimus heterotremus TaxID=100268 RepID=A0A8J4T2E9_9TREM|nr:hypothetical protein PHET_09589 [Paragonimus heterotremus]
MDTVISVLQDWFQEDSSKVTQKFLPTCLQLDTASDITLISRGTWRKLGQPLLLPAHHTPRNASGGTLKLAGGVTYHPGLNLLGLDWMGKLKLLNQPVNNICNQTKIRTRFDNIRPSPLTSANEVHRTGYAQCIRRFNIGDSVLARDFRGQDKWTAVVISKRKGKVIYEVSVGEDTRRKHINQLRRNPCLFPIKPDPTLLQWDILLNIFELHKKADMSCQTLVRQHQFLLFIDDPNEQGNP